MIIDYLVNCGAKINEKNLTGVTPLGKAVEAGRALATVQCLLSHSADPNIADANGNTPLIKAVKNGNVELVKCLLANKATDVNKQNLERNTALHEASFKGIKDMVDGLLAAGANVNIQNSGGMSLLFRLVIMYTYNMCRKSSYPPCCVCQSHRGS
jgi:ankyrin repeat protein